ncbi:response regulator transcription factor [Chitinophaga pendula]|uniref:response regulator transcription factor n=1 Tax=Chitinophaga TaxID=79328 RepID=UPI000BAE8EE4|nr:MULTISPECIES: response regulator transcription factor [Chitinophaga]ASZ12991.1 DNA-binding response regulator [Chitinophaga sp. MD30]UCJ09377.1 response regulator transcription factor [Chitinophaga pendula]
MQPPEINIIIADDHKMLVSGLIHILAEEEDYTVQETFSNGKDLLDFLHANPGKTDLVILDINMPALDGLTALPLLHTAFPLLKILVLSMYTSDEIIARVRKAGAKGFLYKGADAPVLIDTIKSILQGNYVFPKDKNTFQAELSDKAFIKLSLLSPREKEIARLIRDGLTTPMIAAKLFLSEYTVNTHRKNIIHKLELRSTAELIRFATEHNL